MNTFRVNENTAKTHLDNRSFEFKHNLCDNPLLKLDSLKVLLQELPPYRVNFSSNDHELKTNFEEILRNKTKALNLEEIIPSLLTTKSFIAAQNIEHHPAYKSLCASIVKDVKKVYSQAGKGNTIKGATFWLFIASPNAITPFHFDRFSNFIFQIHGSKKLAVFPNFKDNVIHHTQCEKYCSGEMIESPWNDDIDEFRHKYDFKKGDAVHIPFTSGHYVKNGSEEVSISLSVFFHTNQTLIWSRAHRVNNYLRALGLNPKKVGENRTVDVIKSFILPISAIHQKMMRSKL